MNLSGRIILASCPDVKVVTSLGVGEIVVLATFELVSTADDEGAV